MSTATVLAWGTVAVGLLLSLGGLQASLYFARIDKALTGNWVIHRLQRICATITGVAFALTCIRAAVLISGNSAWFIAAQGVLVIVLLTIPITLWRTALTRAGREHSLPQPETQHQREDREHGDLRRDHMADQPETQDEREDRQFGEVRRELEVEHLADTKD